MGMTMMACASPTLVPAMCLTPAYIDDDDFKGQRHVLQVRRRLHGGSGGPGPGPGPGPGLSGAWCEAMPSTTHWNTPCRKILHVVNSL